VFELPNVAIDPDLVPPIATGDTLHATLRLRGGGGDERVLHFKVRYNGVTITPGSTSRSRTWLTFRGRQGRPSSIANLALGMPLQTEPPADLAETSAGAGRPGPRERPPPPATTRTERSRDARFGSRTNGGFDNYARYPRDFDARWNLTDKAT